MDANDINGDSEIDAEEAFLAGDLTDGASYQDTGLVVDPFSRRKLYDDECCTGGCWCLFLFCPSFTCWWYDCNDNWCCISACSGNFYCQVDIYFPSSSRALCSATRPYLRPLFTTHDP
jgi:hypothetical protein